MPMNNPHEDLIKSALLLVDLQNDFCTGGALAVADSEIVIETANRAIELCQQQNIPIIASQDWHPANHLSFAVNSGTREGDIGTLNGIPQVWWPVHCVQGETGADFHPKLNREAICEVFTKGENPQVDSYSAFFDNDRISQTRLHAWLQEQQITQLFIMGIATDYCVKFTVLDALKLGYNVDVLIDGCRGVNLSAMDSELALAEMSQKGATLLTTDSLQ
ncbi:bifunctional nicotinamidase/pyrazinamidase [Providencia vermicola]|uniref:Nicotinamidase n=1 Tax=Providencia vermicola TaxID=333965 RepID=A0AAX3RU56_9GAMM|nr:MULTISPECIES: bifunctional nicotinamidase/pyrazinamidase [Providencia]ELR5119813.1 bifunctional nicotinamidase/pyrazinamidase [Providencia stuartii]ELR5141561.1 bifunctional nicotinamidase/pyrazinamidase [Providencia stuartii]ELX8378059.1 bifunctional nicotinamidase/pyrazinamidase [Providencia stuartii]ELZ5937935.1 bifunctional nicotinamidase/pyrazinamidase [Providencia stuartii]EMD5259501.1 bifunctional nicotinamidase/pyrazinamidase [Providencia stuartii]